MLKLLPVSLLAALTAGCASVAPQQGGTPMFGVMARAAAPAPASAPTQRSNIQVMNAFQPGVSTTTDAVRILGAPTLVNTAPDGRVVYMYDFVLTPQGPMMAGMLFGSNQVLIKIDYFAKGK